MARKPKVFNTLKTGSLTHGRVNVELDESIEFPSSSVVSSVQERYPGFFDCPDKCEPYLFEVGVEGYSLEDGFPAVLDLSKYFNGDDGLRAAPGKSIFRTEYERLNGKIPDDVEEDAPAKPEFFDQIEAENWRRIKDMDEYDLERARREIYEKLDPKAIEFLKNRAKNKDKNPQKLSLFKQRRQGLKPELPKKEPLQDKVVKNLEVISDGSIASNSNIDQGVEQLERLAMDPMHMDFATKYMRSVLPRQEQNMVLLFDKLKIPPKHYDGGDSLINQAREKLREISELFLEEFVTQSGKTERRFGKGVNPVVDSAWSLKPIRNVLDAYEQRGHATSDDLDILRLSLLFTVLLFEEQTSFFYVLYTPAEVYCHLAEVFLMGPDVFKDDVVSACVSRLLNNYLLKKAGQGLLSLKLTKAVSGLDAFMPFYDDLLKRYLEFSLGDPLFSMILLIPAYNNSSISDALTLRILLWSNFTEVLRQTTLTCEQARPLLNQVDRNTANVTNVFDVQFSEQFQVLIGSIQTALEKGLVTQERNPVPFHLARCQLDVLNL